MGRSNAEPSFLMSAGARLTVMRFMGYCIPMFVMAENMRLWASRTALSARPDRNSLSPITELTSTVTVVTCMPLTAAQNVFTSMVWFFYGS